MASNETQRNDRYLYGINPDRVSAAITAKKTQMVADVSAQVSSLSSYYHTFMGVIGGLAVSPLKIGMYWAFCEVVWRRMQTLAGGPLITVVAADLASFVARGLDAGILANLRDQVFTIPDSLAPYFVLKLRSNPDGAAYSISPGYNGHDATGTVSGETVIHLDPDVAQTITLTKALYKTATEELSAPANETVSSTITMTLM